MTTKTPEYRTRNRMKIRTGHSTFDRQCEYLGTGNVSGNVQKSQYVRARTNTECNGFRFEPGHLRESDLRTFRDMSGSGRSDLPGHVRAYIEAFTESESAILYEIRSWRSGRKTVHGYIITRPGKKYGEDEFLVALSTGPTHKSRDILRTVAEYVSDFEAGTTPLHGRYYVLSGERTLHEYNV